MTEMEPVPCLVAIINEGKHHENTEFLPVDQKHLRQVTFPTDADAAGKLVADLACVFLGC